ncbi:MAG: exodeoxyribonuclease VII large subunit, partial [Phycisphaerae bacterium]
STVERVHRLRRTLDELEPIIQRIAPHAHLLRRAVELRDAEHRLRWALSRRLAEAERTISRYGQRLERASPVHVIRRFADGLGRTADAMSAAMRHRLSLHHEQVRRHEQRLGAMSYKTILGRGFSITRIKKGRNVVRSLKPLKDGQRIITEVADGEFESEVINLNQLELFG